MNRHVLSLLALALLVAFPAPARAENLAAEEIVPAPEPKKEEQGLQLTWHLPDEKDAYLAAKPCYPKKRNSIGMMVAGIVLSGLAPVGAVVAAAAADDDDLSPLAAVLVGGVFLGVGIPLAISGASWVDDIPPATLAIGPGRLTFAMVF